MTEVTLKPGWRKWRFDQIATNVNERIDNPSESDFEYYVGLEHIDPDSLKLRRWGSPSDVEATKLIFREGDIIFGRRRVYQRKVAVAEFDGICSAHALVLRAKQNVVIPEFLPFFIQSELFMERAKSISVGSLSPTINWKTLAKQEFYLPPINQQERIANLLEAEVNVIESKLALEKHIFNCRGAARKEILEWGLSKRKTTFKEKTIPYGWTLLPLKEVVDFLDHKRVPIKSSERAKRQGQFPYYGASGIIDHVDDFIFDEELILIGEDGANLLDRTSTLAFKVSGKIWVNNHAHVLKVRQPHQIDYLTDYLESISYKPYVTGTAQPKLNKAALGKISIPVPPPHEQEEIASIYKLFHNSYKKLLSDIDALKKLYTFSLNESLRHDYV